MSKIRFLGLMSTQTRLLLRLLSRMKVSGLGGTAIDEVARSRRISTVITRPETSIRELVLGQQNVVCTEPVS